MNVMNNVTEVRDLSFEDFCHYVEQRMKSVHSEVSLREVQKNNGCKRKALTVKAVCAPCMYLDGYYECYKVEGMSYTLDKIMLDFDDAITQGEEYKEIVFLPWSEIKDCIIFQLVNYERNSEWLKSVPHKRMLDLAIVFRYLIDSDEREMASTVITDSFSQKLGVTTEELYEVACKNTPNLLPYTLGDIGDILGLGDVGANFMWCLTNDKMVNGAACMLYNGVLESIRERFGTNLVIIPSSIHEVLILPVEYEKEMNDMVQEVNKTVLSAEDILADHIYVYDGELKCV